MTHVRSEADLSREKPETPETGETASVTARVDSSSLSHPVSVSHPPASDDGWHDDGAGSGFVLDTGGVYSCEDGGRTKLSSPIQVIAESRDGESLRWGRVYLLTDKDGRLHRVNIPNRLFAGDARAVIAELADHGAVIPPGQKVQRLLLAYLQTAEAARRVQTVDCTGWHALPDERFAFVLPEKVIGSENDTVLLVSDSKQAKFSQRGTPEGWRSEVAARCVGNSRLLLAVSAAFAAPLVFATGEESGGFHFVGGSSSGKTTALRVAASVYGGPDYLHRWRATANAIDALAAQHCDALLILDELGQIDPRMAGEVAYSLANGQGKARAYRTGTARATLHWRILFLSAGEVGLAVHMQEGGKHVRAGQETRLAEVPADAGKGIGMFEALNGAADGNELAKILAEAARTHHGHGGPEFITRIAERRDGWPAIRDRVNQLASRFAGDKADGQVQRVARRFALAAVAGELATHYGITGWPEGAAIAASKACLDAWVAQRGGTSNREPAEVLERVRGFLDAHDARFAPKDGSTDDRVIYNRAGFREDTANGRRYYVFPPVMRDEILKGLNTNGSLRILVEHGALAAGSDSLTRQERLGNERKRVYVIEPKLWRVGEDA